VDLAPRRFADAVVLSPAGRIDHGSADRFRAALQPFADRCRGEAERVVIDLGGVEHVSSAGLRVLMLARKQVKAQSGTLVVASLQPVVREIFEISRFTLVFDVFASVREALAAISPAALAAYDAAAGGPPAPGGPG
jgi:anti-anti-sigma factor